MEFFRESIAGNHFLKIGGHFVYRSEDWRKMTTILVIYVSVHLGNKQYLPSRYKNHKGYVLSILTINCTCNANIKI